MNIQVLVATMNQKDYSLIDKMRITTDAIIANQCEKNSIDQLEYNNHSITYLNFAERGVGLNRNNALMRASGEICLFADDDMVFKDGYERIVRNVFIKHPKADVIIFNLDEKNKSRYVIKKEHRVSRINYLRYGTARIAIRLRSVKLHGIYFNQCFGGGTEHCHGEDNLFLTDCLRKRLRIVAVPESIAFLNDERESTWRTDNLSKYLNDQGLLFRCISPRLWFLLCLQDSLRHHKTYNLSFSGMLSQMIRRK